MATEFTVFPKCAPEIREMIWAEASFDRVITITEIPYYLMMNQFDEGQAMVNDPNIPQFNSSAINVPAVLHTNREARRVARKSYHLFFEKHCRNPFYFNPAFDTIFLPSLTDYLAFMSYTNNCDEMKSIRYLAIGGDFHSALWMSPMYGQELGPLENLESLIIQTGLNFGLMEKFQVRRQLGGHWKKENAKEGGSSEEKIAMQNPDIVFLGVEEMRGLGLIQ
ncbi:hypothetical protein N431DRAFT_119360 [Stipitochalara longipes BDJ]|nr:hypothetical protein N431DRAFT_119360 [Stipitochalara longipes BDJ]